MRPESTHDIENARQPVPDCMSYRMKIAVRSSDSIYANPIHANELAFIKYDSCPSNLEQSAVV